MSIRPVKSTSQAQPTMEGTGVHLHRAFGFHDPSELDPFLLFDDFRNDIPDHYAQGFPWHPPRGIETIAYVLSGEVDHADSLGNEGKLAAGDVQWMTSGSGILHQEMPRGNANGQMHGFQLWANLPRDLKMTTPRYQDVEAKEIPFIEDDDGTVVKVIVGGFRGKTGPLDGIAAEPQYLDVFVPAGVKKTLPVDTYRRAFAYVFEGAGAFVGASNPTGVLLEKEVMGEEGIRFLLISGKPIEEPVAWHGPIVMNTQEELMQAFKELRNGTFIRLFVPPTDQIAPSHFSRA